MSRQRSVFICLWLSLLGCVNVLSAQQLLVQDEDGIPLVGVHVRVGEVVVVTDLDGTVSLDETTAELVEIAYLGYQELVLTKTELEARYYGVRLVPDDKLLEEVVIYGRTDAREIDLPYNVTRIKSESIFSSNAQNSADALALNSGAYVQKSQLGGGSPVLRGFEANKVLLVVDGVRLNNAIYRNGHLQNAITIDPAILEQMEVINGAGSLLYGSEALGGVIHFRTKDPLLNFSNDKAHQLNSYIRYNSADKGQTAHVDYTYAAEQWGVLSSVSLANRGDLRMGAQRSDAYPFFGLRPSYVIPAGDPETEADQVVDNPNSNIQVGTGYQQIDLMQKWIWRPSDVFKATFNIQYSTSSDIPRYDNLSEYRNGQLRFADWRYGPQKRFLFSPKVVIKKPTAIFDKTTIIYSYQKIEESRLSRRLNDPVLETQIESVQILGLTVDFNKRLTNSQKLTYGIDAHYNDVQSRAEATAGANILTRYPSGGSQLRNFGGYLQHNWQNKDSSLVWINGLRYSTQKTDLAYQQTDPFVWPDYFYEGITSNNSAVVGITGINFQYKNWLAKASTGTAFRSPNVDDLAKVRVNGDEVTIPNPNLDSEKVWNSELTIGYRSPKFTVGLTGYYTQLKDAIVRTDFTLPDGSNIYISGPDTLQVTANVNASQGWIRGLSANVSLSPIPALYISSNVNIQKGQAENQNGETQPLGHIPPSYGQTKLSYTYKQLSLSAAWQYNAWKRIEAYGGSVDNPELGAVDIDDNPVGTPAWHTLGLSSQIELKQHWTINLALENILDVHFRSFASGVSGAGRHVIVGLRYRS